MLEGPHIKGLYGASTAFRRSRHRTRHKAQSRSHDQARSRPKACPIPSLYRQPTARDLPISCAVLLSIASMDTAALAKLCQCSMMDAIAERRLCAQAVIPDVAQKLPVQLDVRTAKTINLNLLSPVEFAEVEKLANTDEASDSDGSFSLQLITTAEPAHEQTTAQPAQGQSVESGDHGTPVTPAVAADVPQGPAGGYLRPLAEFFDGPSRARRQRIEDAPPARDERDSWQRTHEGGTWPPDRKSARRCHPACYPCSDITLISLVFRHCVEECAREGLAIVVRRRVAAACMARLGNSLIG